MKYRLLKIHRRAGSCCDPGFLPPPGTFRIPILKKAIAKDLHFLVVFILEKIPSKFK